ncbi:MAG: division/cell wall cluster transcriptional repressor MraZ [Bacillota bacterium]|nr:division/cell wall cluster transcriptional repressor MraZ [Bacillota bacterium]
MFIGEYQNSIDEKGRIIVPTKLREELGYRFVMTKGLDRCITVYPMKEWEKLQEKLSTLPVSSKEARAFIRFLTGGAAECEMDKQGRVVVPPHLRTYAVLEKDAVTVGATTRVEVWSRAMWETYADTDMNDEAMAEKMVEYNI